MKETTLTYEGKTYTIEVMEGTFVIVITFIIDPTTGLASEEIYVWDNALQEYVRQPNAIHEEYITIKD